MYSHLYHSHSEFRYKKIFPILWCYAALLAVTALILDTPQNILAGLEIIVRSEDALITDYILIAGPGAAMMNSALVTAISILVLYFSNDVLNGMTMVVIGLMSGFSFFGKNFLNIWPLLLGTWLYAKFQREPFFAYANIGLMGTALAPIVSYIGLDNGWGSPLLGILTGLIIGFILPPLSIYTYRIQNGMNLYNVGFACGLIAFIFVPLISSMGANPTTQYHWSHSYTTELSIFLSIFSVFLIVCGLFFAGIPYWAAWAGYRRLLHSSGRSPSDFLRMFGSAPILINTGINGLIGMAFILLVGGDLNGPTLGGILTLMGFSSFGKHAKNIVPVMFGVALGGIIMHWTLSDPAVQLACLFCTTLAPISGYFGWPYGVLAGFLHSSVVLYTGSPVAGLNLYNNGFSGGLVAIVLYPTILSIVRHRKPTLQEKDYFDNMEEDTPITPPDTAQYTEEQL